MMLVCDACRCPIFEPRDGWLEWILRDGRGYGFRVCHKMPMEGKSCFAYDIHPDSRGAPLESFVGEPGIVKMVDILVEQIGEISWGRMFSRLLESGVFDDRG